MIHGLQFTARTSYLVKITLAQGTNSTPHYSATLVCNIDLNTTLVIPPIEFLAIRGWAFPPPVSPPSPRLVAFA